jgi:acyl-coenzyme A thioesterase PaaI-like protein
MIDDATYLAMIGAARLPGDSGSYSLEFSNKIEGRPGTFHGGAMIGFLECVALGVSEVSNSELEPLSMTIGFLRLAGAKALHASASITHQSHRIVRVHVTAWQDDPTKPVAEAKWLFATASRKGRP